MIMSPDALAGFLCSVVSELAHGEALCTLRQRGELTKTKE